MSDKHEELRPVRATTVKSPKGNGQIHQRRAHIRKTMVGRNASTTESVDEKGLTSGLVGLSSDYPKISTKKYGEELAPVLAELHRILDSGKPVARPEPWKEGHGDPYRVGENGYRLRRTTADGSVIGTRGFGPKNQTLMYTETNRINREFFLKTKGLPPDSKASLGFDDVAVSTKWGTVEDWKSVGVDVDPNELANGVELIPEEDIKEGTVVYHITQTLGYNPMEDLAGSESDKPTDQIAEDILAIMIEKIDGGVNVGPFSAFMPDSDVIRVLPKTAYDDKMKWLNVFMHEIGHSTGIPSELKRPLHDFDSEDYSSPEYLKLRREEEMVAELTAAIVLPKVFQYCAEKRGASIEFPPELAIASAQYLWGFLSEPRGEMQGFQWAVDEAEKAADQLLGAMLGDQT